MNMKPWQFLRFDAAGACLYVLAYGTAGYLAHDFVADITRGLQNAGHVLGEVIGAAIVAFVLYRFIQYRRYKMADVVPRVAVEELARRIAGAEKDEVIVVDVRSHGYYDSGTARIAGSVRIEPNRLDEELKSLSKDKDIYVYCT